ncbi:hypothetical protein Dimus_017227 [Dionaea muscipula]
MESAKSTPADPLRTPEKIRRIDGQHQPPPWAVKTPKQLSHPPRRTLHRPLPPPGRVTKLPDKYEILWRIFNAMDSSLRLLRMRKSMPMFSRISTMVECMTERRFGYGHLAQLKFLLPEEIVIKGVSLLDDETRCMKRDLHVKLNPGVVRNDKKRKRGHGTGATSLRDLLSLRLSEFHETQPEGTEIPKAILPEPFNRLEEDQEINTAKTSRFVSHAEVSAADSLPVMHPKPSSHLSQSFRIHFSGKTRNVTPVTAATSSPVIGPTYSSPEPTCTGANVSMTMTTPSSQLPSTCSRSFVHDGSQFPEQEGSPIQLCSTPSKFMGSTPPLLPPKRTSISPEEEEPTSTSRVIVRRPFCARVLKFDGHIEKANVELELSDTDSDDILDTLPEDLLQSLKLKDKTSDEQQATRRKTMASIPRIFDRILYLFQSTKSSFIRREELINKLTECHSDIVDECEIEEQLKLLQGIIPDWISHKLCPDRGILYCINKTLSPELLRARINKAAWHGSRSSKYI